MQPDFLFVHVLRGVGTCFGFGVLLDASQHKKEDRSSCPRKKVERSSTMDDVGVFGIVAQAVDRREADGSSEAAALPVGAR